MRRLNLDFLNFRIALAATLTIATLASVASAQSTSVYYHYRHRRVRIYEARPAIVAPQPFSLDRQFVPPAAPAIQVAYYSPRQPSGATPIEHEHDNDEGPAGSQFETNGSHPTVPGNHAVLRNGIAYAPSNAPDRVKHAIWAVNTIRNRPYVWGGGHGSFSDRGYDCSGTVSFALHYAAGLNQPLASSELLQYGERGRGRWVTIYSRHGHTFATIAGLRLDTTDFRYGGDVGPRWHLDGRDTWGFEARHPAGL